MEVRPSVMKDGVLCCVMKDGGLCCVLDGISAAEVPHEAAAKALTAPVR
jgi:hypothetical protein